MHVENKQAPRSKCKLKRGDASDVWICYYNIWHLHVVVVLV